MNIPICFAVNVVLLGQFNLAIAESDYAREKSWADEITPTVVVGDPIYLEQQNHHRFLALYTKASDAKLGVVVVHGVGRHPDIGLIGTLRRRLPDYGYTTLSIQMPILAADATAKEYAELLQLPDANERLQLGVDWLKAKGYARVAIVSHSLGSRMTHKYMKSNPPDVIAWAALGTGTGPGPVITYDGIRVPVLDLFGENELPPVLEGASKRKASLENVKRSKQIIIPNTDHFFLRQEDEMVKAVREFLDTIIPTSNSQMNYQYVTHKTCCIDGQ